MDTVDSPEPELSNDKDSVHVNPGSPPDQLPPLNDYTTKREPERKISEESTETEVSKARFIIDPEGEFTHDQTTVDIVTVPCPGADPLRTWSRDGLMSRYYGALSMRDAEGAASEADRPAPSWVRQGLRREADRARILLYEHPSTTEDTRLSTLADALLEELGNLRKREKQTRPVVFVGHSIGGIIVKMVLTKASRDPSFEDIYRQCYGAAFFGSSYFAMPSLATGIQNLLQLSAPMPTSITDDLRVGNTLLLQLDDDFKSMAHDFRIWTLYETIDSRLSGSSGDVYFTAPLTSIKSAILGMRQETILPLQSDHANIASFGRHNVHTMRLFLKQLSALIGRADEYSREDGNWSLNLEQKVNVEVHGFFEDPPGPMDVATIRAWSTRLPLRDFLRKGPEECLAERLNEVETVDEGRFLRNRGKTTMLPTEKVADERHDNPLGISQGSIESPPASPIIRPVDAEKTRSESAPQTGAISPATPLSPAAISPPTHYSTPMRRPSPIIRANFEQDLAVDRLSPPPRGRMGRSLSRSVSMGTQASQYEYKDFPPFSQRSRSTIEGFSDDDEIDASPRLPEAIVAIRKAASNGERRASETVIVDEVPVAFSKPQIETRKFMWVHLPYNNPSWVTKMFETLQTANNRNYAPLFNNDFWATRHSRGRHSQHYAYFAKPGSNRVVSPRGRSSKQSSISPKPEGGIYTCLFLPYLHFDSYKRLIRRRELILQRLGHGRARPVPETVAKSDSLESQVIWEFLGHDPPLNCRRTLDQYGYPSLRDTRSRDDDQMLYKLTKERTFALGLGPGLHGQMSNSSSGSSGSGSRRSKTSSQDGEDEEGCEDPILNGNVLMVDQLWLWAIDSHTLLSFFPKREGDAIEGPLYQQADLRDSIFNEVNVDLTRQCENALDLAALAVLHAVTVLLDRSSHPDLEVFRIFEEAISVLTEKLTSSLKIFRAEGFRDKASAYEPVENKARSIRARHKAEGRRAEEDNRDNTSALLELRDIEDELLILVHLFERQSKVVSSMLSTYTRPELRGRTANGRLFLSEAIKKVSEYTHQAQEMIQRVRSTRNDYDKLLQMVQRQAQVDEVRLSRLHADLASAQSRSVMIFTTFTVIFLPLTFFTGLFGMNTQEWGGENNLSLKTIGTISLPASFALVVFSLVAAFSANARLLIKWLAHLYRHMMSWVWRTLCKPAVAKVTDMLPQVNERQKEERDSRSGKRVLREEMSDFWERHRLERDRGYTVPEKNKRTVSARLVPVEGQLEAYSFITHILVNMADSPRYAMGTQSSQRRTSPIRKGQLERPGTPTRRPTTPTVGRRPTTPTLGRRGSNASLRRQGPNTGLNRPVTPTATETPDGDPVKVGWVTTPKPGASPGSPDAPARILPAIPESPLVMPSPRSRQVSRAGITPRSRQVSTTDAAPHSRQVSQTLPAPEVGRTPYVARAPELKVPPTVVHFPLVRSTPSVGLVPKVRSTPNVTLVPNVRSLVGNFIIPSTAKAPRTVQSPVVASPPAVVPVSVARVVPGVAPAPYAAPIPLSAPLPLAALVPIIASALATALAPRVSDIPKVARLPLTQEAPKSTLASRSAKAPKALPPPPIRLLLGQA
ncbi:hypothetical protein FAGAP_2317 [Fusarium agapanthi]|uniref:DUF676 domain-containing protein n=1 Tax=Fusarium agapanthi TaxID=1803897 RepID=A0A9P5BHJ1_9HYPO|nr:hypothetical protein FAGAP_2317 [Fusarium agapanthi]